MARLLLLCLAALLVSTASAQVVSRIATDAATSELIRSEILARGDDYGEDLRAGNITGVVSYHTSDVVLVLPGQDNPITLSSNTTRLVRFFSAFQTRNATGNTTRIARMLNLKIVSPFAALETLAIAAPDDEDNDDGVNNNNNNNDSDGRDVFEGTDTDDDDDDSNDNDRDLYLATFLWENIESNATLVPTRNWYISFAQFTSADDDSLGRAYNRSRSVNSTRTEEDGDDGEEDDRVKGRKMLL
jgi:hypothetical protein